MWRARVSFQRPGETERYIRDRMDINKLKWDITREGRYIGNMKMSRIIPSSVVVLSGMQSFHMTTCRYTSHVLYLVGIMTSTQTTPIDETLY
ncbi:unnamed protein product [Allacma fusca]|uniref:Uncharacterized protein n=1 Tax=Allacma fusca TaxID=39272 RepID=A0A8J2KYK5_9HEXA|nr:unnamed protein product [Allacma fusca]